MQHYDQDERDGDAANCVPQPPVCNDGDVKKDGMCVPAEQCQPPNAVRHDACVPPNEACRPGKILKDGTCIPAEDCKVPNTVVNGVCTPPHNPECQPPNTVVNGVCTPPVDNRGCAPSQVLQNGVCVTPAPNTNVAGQAAAPAAGSTPLTTAEPGEAAPAAGVAGTLAASASARLRTQARCGTRTFRVTINGRKIRRITLSVAGRRVRTITMPAGRTSITVSVPVRRFGARRQSVQARVTFRNGATARTLTASATRCAQAAVSPQFTG